jgi:hypothetical protein
MTKTSPCGKYMTEGAPSLLSGRRVALAATPPRDLVCELLREKLRPCQAYMLPAVTARGESLAPRSSAARPTCLPSKKHCAAIDQRAAHLLSPDAWRSAAIPALLRALGWTEISCPFLASTIGESFPHSQAYVRRGTLDAIRDTGHEIDYCIEVRTTQDDSHAERHGSDWHNGYFLSKLSRKR